MKKTLKLLLLLLLINTNCIAQIAYVKHDATGLNNGTSWQDAYNDLSLAIYNAQKGEIWVAAGTYKPSTDVNGLVPENETLKSFKLKINIAIYGGFMGNETSLSQRDWVNNQTILSGDIGVSGIYTDNCRHVISSEYLTLNKNTILDGITIRDGYSSSQYEGAGIFVNQTSDGTFILRNSIIENNYAFRGGGGLYVFNCNPVIENNIFRNNQAFEGGAMYLDYSDALVSNNQIINNRADNYPNGGYSRLSGGGIYVSSYSSPQIIGNTIKDNFSLNEGGGVTIDSNYHTVFKNNIVTNNTAEDGGGVFLDYSQTYFFNNVFAENTATRSGGALYMDYSPNQLEFINNTVVFNTAGLDGGGLYLSGANPNIVNSIFYNNTARTGSQIRAISNNGNWSPDFRYCNIQGGLSGIVTLGNAIIYENNIDKDPMFIDLANDNFRLSQQSSLIDAGTTSSLIFNSPWAGTSLEVINFPITDLEGNARVLNKIDMGAYEFGTTLGIPTNHLATNKTIIYPNPSNGIYFIDPNVKYESFSIHSATGAEITTSKSNFATVDLTKYSNGFYFITLMVDGKKQSYKLIKE